MMNIFLKQITWKLKAIKKKKKKKFMKLRVAKSKLGFMKLNVVVKPISEKGTWLMFNDYINETDLHSHTASHENIDTTIFFFFFFFFFLKVDI